MIIAQFLMMSLPLAAATHHFDKRVDPGSLQRELISAGFEVESINCLGTRCHIIMPEREKKNPSAVIAAHRYQNPELRVRDRRAEAKALAQKLKTGGASASEKDRLLLLLTNLVLGE